MSNLELSKRLRPKGRTLFLYMLPSVGLFLIFTIIPVAMAIYYSLFKWSGGKNMKFLGLDNYVRLVGDSVFRQALLNNLILAVFCVIFQVGIAFIISSLLCSKFLKLHSFHRFAIFMPVVLAPVVVGFLWKIVYNQDYGLLNYTLRAVGLQSFIRPWVDDMHVVMKSITVPIVWQWIGLYVVIFVTAMKNISEEIFESATLDGASGIKQAIYITYPMIMDTVKISVILAVSGCMKIFDHIYIISGGGPGTASMVGAMYAYKTSFTKQQFGYGSSISVGIMLVSLTLVLLCNIIFGKGKKKYD
ncbi:sugar ABC transporter permease [Lachnospiraceae bacterium ZAX-1]